MNKHFQIILSKITLFMAGCLVFAPTKTANTQSFLAIGSYTGNGSDNRNITGVGFTPDVVLIKGNTTKDMILRTSSMSGDVSKKFNAGAQLNNCIQSILSDGFQLGSDANVNSNGITYYWAALIDQPTNFTTGSYAGNNTSNRAITGLGFQPQYVFVFSDAGDKGAFTSKDMATGKSCIMDDVCNTSNLITSLDSDGFKVGTNAMVNANSQNYYWIAGRTSGTQGGAAVDVGTYTGNGSDNRSLSVNSYSSDFIWIKGDASSNKSVFRFSNVSGDLSLQADAQTPTTNMIQAINSSGFEVGTSGYVNTNNVDYYWITIRETGGVLPVKWLNWHVRENEKGEVLAEWTSANESNAVSFAIERSTDGIAFEEIKRIIAIGNEDGSSYSVPDLSPWNGQVWYRVREISKTGENALTENFPFYFRNSAPEKFTFVAGPNPVTNHMIHVKFSEPQVKEFEIRLYDVTGKIVYAQTIGNGLNGNDLELPIPVGIAPGVYFIQAGNSNSNFRTKVLVEN